MDIQKIRQIFEDTAYVRMGGTDAELKCAEYLVACCAAFGCKAEIESFAVDMARVDEAVLTVDGREIPCLGYFNAGSASVEAPLYYLSSTDPHALSLCRGKIVLLDGYMGYWRYQDILEHGAVGFITYSGNENYPDQDIDQRELRTYVSKGNKLPGVNINVRDAIALVESGAQQASIRLAQEEWEGESRNVVVELPGDCAQYIVMTAHYDSTSLSQGAYDNMSGSVGLLALAEHFATHPHHYGLRLVWCGSEERGLLGSKAWVAAHADLIEQTVLNVNLDMIGCIMGKFIACVTAEEKLCHYIEYMGQELGFGVAVRQDVYSSDSTPFADAGVPALSFARISPAGTAPIHCRYDTLRVMKPEQMAKDIAFIQAFMERMLNARCCPVKRVIPENMKEKLDEYLARKRPKNA